MHFELIGKITKVETIATGRGLRDLNRLRKRYGRAGGESSKAWRQSESPVARFAESRYIGTKRMGSDECV